jgi:hypothetical protein
MSENRSVSTDDRGIVLKAFMRPTAIPDWQRHKDRQNSKRLLFAVLGFVAILVIFFLASWMDTRCSGSAQRCAEQETFQP